MYRWERREEKKSNERKRMPADNRNSVRTIQRLQIERAQKIKEKRNER